MNHNEAVRRKNPLVHCITNYVTVNDVANALLACGGSPIMADAMEEAAEITSMAQALVLNIGTLNRRTMASMTEAGRAANQRNIPVVLDPVGAGASALRNEAVKTLLENIQCSVIRGNLSEISYIAGMSSSTRGVDASEADRGNDAAAAAKAAARLCRCVVALTGPEDLVTDGGRTVRIQNGLPQMSRVSGTGCMLTGVIGAYAGANDDPYMAVIGAVVSMGLAGELAVEGNPGGGTGSLRVGIIDALSQIDDRLIARRGKIIYEE